MKSIKNYINESRRATKPFKADTKMVITKKSETEFTVGDKTYSGKFILLCGDKYPYHMKGNTGYYDKSNDIHIINYHDNSIDKYGVDEDWDLPEIYYADSKEILLDRIDDINRDNYFREHSHYSFSEDDIIEVSKITKPIKVYED